MTLAACRGASMRRDMSTRMARGTRTITAIRTITATSTTTLAADASAMTNASASPPPPTFGGTPGDQGCLTQHALYRLLAWSSPGYPTGAFSYSHGLEWAVEAGTVTNLQGLLDYVTAVLSRGGGWIDAVLFVHAWRTASRSARLGADSDEHALTARPRALAEITQPDALAEITQANALAEITDPDAFADTTGPDALAVITELAAAFRGSSETALESRQQGAAFLDVTRKAWPHPILDTLAAQAASTNTPVAHCVAVAVACAAHEIPLLPALHAYLHAVGANLVSAGARLIPLGQTQAQIAIAQLSPIISGIIERAQSTSLGDLGTAAPAVELCSLRHETQYTRLFRS